MTTEIAILLAEQNRQLLAKADEVIASMRELSGRINEFNVERWKERTGWYAAGTPTPANPQNPQPRRIEPPTQFPTPPPHWPNVIAGVPTQSPVTHAPSVTCCQSDAQQECGACQ